MLPECPSLGSVAIPQNNQQSEDSSVVINYHPYISARHVSMDIMCKSTVANIVQVMAHTIN